MGCESDDLTEQHKQFIRDLSSSALQVEYRTVPDIKIKNDFSPRFGLNWIKLNSWNMTEFDTVINLDTGESAEGHARLTSILKVASISATIAVSAHTMEADS